jgi:glycine C-acetyltransferase
LVGHNRSFLSKLEELKKNNLYRDLRPTRKMGTRIGVNGRVAINFTSNDYLGLSIEPKVIAKTVDSLRYVSQCSSRLVSGNSQQLEELESELARHRKTASSLVYTSGYCAILGILSTILDKDTVVFSDRLNHASIIDGCRLGRSKVKIFAHQNLDHLTDLMSKVEGRKILITEGLFSIGGDLSNLKAICKIAKDFNALTIVDDAHGDFVFGKNGSGVPSYFGVNKLVDIHISSLSKGLGCFGGYVAVDKTIRSYLINKSRQFIYTSALPSHLCVAALTALKIANTGNLQARLFKNIKRMSINIKKYGFNIGESVSQIIPLMIGSEKIAIKFSKLLLDKGIFVQPLRYPTVEMGRAVLRISITAAQSVHEIDACVEAIYTAGKKLKII